MEIQGSSQAVLAAQVQAAVMNMAQDSAEMSGEAMLEVIQSASPEGVGANIDVTA
ncbi:MAG: putative motility protein [Fibrobacterota bacterium]